MKANWTLRFPLPEAGQTEAQQVVRGIAKLKVNRTEFDWRADALQRTSVVYKHAVYDAELVAQWCPEANTLQEP